MESDNLPKDEWLMPTGESTNLGESKEGWNPVNKSSLSNLPHGEDVLVFSGGKEKMMKWNRNLNLFTGDDFHINPAGIKSGTYVDPVDAIAFGRGEDVAKQASRDFLKNSPTSVASAAAFIYTHGALAAREVSPWASYPLAMLASGATGAAVDAGMKAGFGPGDEEQARINAAVNPVATAVSTHGPMFLSFRPSYSVAKGLVSMEPEALKTVAKGGLMNMLIAQGNSTGGALITGTQDPNAPQNPLLNRGVAAVRSLGFGDPNVEDGGGIGDRLGHAGKEFAIGAMLHKPWLAGAAPHNMVAPAHEQVKVSGYHTEAALDARRQILERQKAYGAIQQAAQAAREAQLVREELNRQSSKNGGVEIDPLSPGNPFEPQGVAPTSVPAESLSDPVARGIATIKEVIDVHRSKGAITEEEARGAHALVDSLHKTGALDDVTIAQLGGDSPTGGREFGMFSKVYGTIMDPRITKEQRAKIESLHGKDRTAAIEEVLKGLPAATPDQAALHAISVFSRAYRQGENGFTTTFTHEILHPLFEALKPEVKSAIERQYVEQKSKARKDPVLGIVLDYMGFKKGDESWTPDSTRITENDRNSMIRLIRNKGLNEFDSNGQEIFQSNGDGTYRLNTSYTLKGAEKGQRLYRFFSPREFFSEEGARWFSDRYKGDKRLGAEKNSMYSYFDRIYNGIKDALLGRFTPETVERIMRKIASGKAESVTQKGVRALSEQNIALGDLIDDAGRNAAELTRQKRETEMSERTKSFVASEPPVSDDGGLGDEINRRRRFEPSPASDESLTEVEIARRTFARLSEGDSDPANPEPVKGTDEMLKKLGIKRTVAANIVQHRKIGSIEGFAVMDTPEKVTHAFRNNAHMVQESVQMLVTDSKHRPLEIIRHTIAEPGASALSMMAMATQVASVKGAKHVWVTHNHPSQTPEFSSADHMAGMAIVDRLFKGFGVTPMGFFAQAGENRSVFKDGKFSTHDRVVSAATPADAGDVKKIPIVERRFEFKRGTGHDQIGQNSIRNETEAKDFVANTIKDKPGVIFLDNKSNPVGTHEIRFTESGNLGRTGARELMAAFSRTGAKSVIISTGGEQVAPDVQAAIAKNVDGLFGDLGLNRERKVKYAISMDKTGKVSHSKFNSTVNYTRGWRSEGDADQGQPYRTEYESRVGVTKIKPLHAAPPIKFPIRGVELEKFGIDRGSLNQFSEHAVVGKIESPVATVKTPQDAAMLIDDYAGHLEQGQTLILITDKNGKPLQVGLHMISPTSDTDNGNYRPMLGVLAGQAVSTPGAKEAWFIKVANNESTGMRSLGEDKSTDRIDVLRNLLDGTGITFRGAIRINDGRYTFNGLEKFTNADPAGTHIHDTSIQDQQIPIHPEGNKYSFKITERRFSTRTQVAYEAGAQRPDAEKPMPTPGRRKGPQEWNDSIEEEMGKQSGLVFAANSGHVTGHYPLTIDQMMNIRGTDAQKAILAMADRVGSNWVTIHFGDVDGNDNAMLSKITRARVNMGRFLHQANLKNDVVMYRDSSKRGRVVEPGGTHGDSGVERTEMEWKSEGDDDMLPIGRRSAPDTEGTGRINLPKGYGGPWKEEPLVHDDRARTTPYASFTPAMVDKLGIKSGKIEMSMGNVRKIKDARGNDDFAGSGLLKIFAKHTVDFENHFGVDFNEKLFPGQNLTKEQAIETIILAALQNSNIEGFSRFGSGTNKGYRATQDNRLTILSHFNGVRMEIVLDTESGVKGTPHDANELMTAFPIDKRRYELIKDSAKYVSNGKTDMRQARLSELRRSQANSGLEMPGVLKNAGGQDADRPPVGDPFVRVKGKIVGERRRGMSGPTSFSEGDAAEFGDRAEKAFKADDIVGPEAIRGDFLGWVKSTKALADQHLYQHPFPGNSGDYEGDVARDKSRQKKHAVIDQVLAKLERQKGFNPMTLKPGMLKELRDIAEEVSLIQFKEIARNGVNMMEHIEDDIPRRHVEYYRNAAISYHEGFIKQVYMGMNAGMISKRTGMNLVDMANEMRSHLTAVFDSHFPGDGTRMSEGDAENMNIPGGARDAFMKGRPAKQVKTYLNIGHGDVEGEYGNAMLKGNFKPDDTFLYTYNHGNGRFNMRNIGDMAREAGVEAKNADDFAHGMGGNLIENDLRLGRYDTGVSGRIELDHENKLILVSAGSSRGKLDPEYTSKSELIKRSDALKEIRANVERLQDEGKLPRGYKVEGYGFARENMFKDNFQERFSEGDSGDPLTQDYNKPNHSDRGLARAGFITRFSDKNMPARFRGRFVLDVIDPENGNKVEVSDLLGNHGDTNMSLVIRDTKNRNTPAAEIHIYFNHGKAYANVDQVYVRKEYENNGISKILYAELGERLRRMGVESLSGFVVDDHLRPIKARKAVFGEKSTGEQHHYFEERNVDTGKMEKKWSAADVKTTIDPNRKLSEGDSIEMPPSTNPKTKDGEIANHTDVQLAKRGFITLRAKENAKSMAGMKMTIKEKGYQDGQRVNLDKIEGTVQHENDVGEGEFHGVIEYNGEDGLQKVADFIYKVMPGDSSGSVRKFNGGGDLDWIKVQPIWRNRDISTVIVAEVAERIRRSYGSSLHAYVVDPYGRPIKAINRALGEGNVVVDDYGYEETSPRDQFATQGPDGEYVRRSWDVNADIRRNRLLSEGDDVNKNYEGLAFSEADIRRWNTQTPAERRAFYDSLPDDRNRKEFRLMQEHVRQQDFDNRPGAQERRAKHEARRQEVIEKYKAQGHPYPDLAADRELNPPPTGPDPEAQLEQMRRRQSDQNKLNSEGDDGENMRIPGGARDQFNRASARVNRPKPIRFWTDVGHADRTDAEGEQNTYLWFATKKGDISVISADDLRHAQSPEGYQMIASDDIPTHVDWQTALSEGFLEGDFGSQPIMDLPHGRIDDRGDVTRISFMDHHNVGRTDYEFHRDEIKKKLAEYMGKKAEEMPGYDFTKTNQRGYEPERFSEGDSENGRWSNQARAKGKIPNARFNNGETDLGFALGPGEALDSRGGILRDKSIREISWGDIGHEPLQWRRDSGMLISRLEDEGRLQTDIDFANGLFAFDQKTSRFEVANDHEQSSHAGWLGVEGGTDLLLSNSEWNPKFGMIPDDYSYLGRIEVPIIAKDGTVVRRGRISLGANRPEKSWVENHHDMLMSEFPRDFIQHLKKLGASESSSLVDYKGDPATEAQKATPDMFDVYGFGMKSDKENVGISHKDFGPIKMSEGDAEVMRDVATKPIGEGKEGQTRLKAIAARMSEGDEVNEPPFRIPKVAPGRTNLEIAKDIVTARFFTGISTKAHDIAKEFPGSQAAKTVADMIHARAGAEAGVTGLDIPTSIMKERTRLMNRFFEIMDPLRSDFASMSRDVRESAYRDFAEMVTGTKPIDKSTAAGRAAEGLKALLRDMHDYRTSAGEKLGEVADYFPAVYDSIRIADDAMAFKDDAKRAYMLELAGEYQGQDLDAAAEKAARELTMSHVRGESAGMFASFFEEGGGGMGENSSKSRTFGPEAQEIMSKWQVKDPYRIISRYISNATKRAEIVRRLGDEGQTWRKLSRDMERQGVSYEKIDEMRGLLKAALGIGREPNSRGEQTYIDLMGLYTAGSVMGRSFLNNMFEPGSMGMRSGNLSLALQAYGETWGRTIHNAARILSGERIDKTFWEKYAEHIGTMSADINDAWMNSHSIEVDGDRSDPRINWLTSKVYQSNLLQLTENAKLQASHAIGFRYLLNLAEMQQGRSFMNKLDVTESVRSNLRELGIEDADHAAFAKWMLRLDGMDDAARMRTMTSGGKMSQLFETAMTKFSMQASVRANRAHKPIFQDGAAGKTLFQLMSYSYSYAAEVNSRAYEYAKSSLKSAPAGKSYTVGDRIRFLAPVMLAPLGIIAFRAMFELKDKLYPTQYSKQHENDPDWIKWLNASSFAGIFGPKIEMATKYVMRDQPPGGPLGQAAIGYARAAKTAISNTMEGKSQDNAVRQATKASIQPIKAAATIGATAIHPAAGVIASQLANMTNWSNAMTETDKNSGVTKPKRK